MLARLARRRGSSLLARALHADRLLRSEADGHKKQEAPLVFAGRKQSALPPPSPAAAQLPDAALCQLS